MMAVRLVRLTTRFIALVYLGAPDLAGRDVARRRPASPAT
jgi:hypothetical protein